MAGPRINSLYSVGSDTVDLSTTDATFDPATQDVPVAVRVDAATTLKVTGYNDKVDTHTLAAGETLSMAVVKIWKVGTTPLTGIHAMY